MFTEHVFMQHQYQLIYILAKKKVSPLSPPGSGYIDLTDTSLVLTSSNYNKPADVRCIRTPLSIPSNAFNLSSTYEFELEATLLDEDGEAIRTSEDATVMNSETIVVKTTSIPDIGDIKVSQSKQATNKKTCSHSL